MQLREVPGFGKVHVLSEDTYFSARNTAEFVARSPEKDLLVSHLEMLKHSQAAATGVAAFFTHYYTKIPLISYYKCQVTDM